MQNNEKKEIEMADLMEIEPIDLMEIEEIDIKPSNSNKQNSHE